MDGFEVAPSESARSLGQRAHGDVGSGLVKGREVGDRFAP